nr:hypothetical protein [Tanacetum cinerariifolium]
MESLSEVSAYLNELDSTLDDGISTMMVEESVEVEKEAKVYDSMDIIVDTKENAKVKQEIVVFTKALLHEDVEADFVVVDYVNERKPSIVFGMSFLMTIKSQVDFRLGKIRINITMLRKNKDVDALFKNLLKNMVDISDASREQVKTGKANCLKTIE